MKTIITTGRSVYRCTRYFDRIAQSDHIMIEKRRTFLELDPGDLETECKFCVKMYEEGLVTSALLKNV